MVDRTFQEPATMKQGRSNNCRLGSAVRIGRTAILLFFLLAFVASTCVAEDHHWHMAAQFGLNETNAKEVTQEAILASRAFFQAPENDDARLVLHYPAGTYWFGQHDEGGSAILLEDFHPGTTGRLVFRGAGRNKTTFVFNHNQDTTRTDEIAALSFEFPEQPEFKSTAQNGIRVIRSNRITFRDLHITVPQQTVSQGFVIAHGSNWVDIRIDEGYPAPTDLMLDRQNARGRYLRRYRNHSVVKIDETLGQLKWLECFPIEGTESDFRFMTRKVPQFSVGDLIGIKGKHGKDVYRFSDCTDIKMVNLRLSRKTRGVFLRCSDVFISNLLARPEVVGEKMACLASPGGGPQFHAAHGGYGSPNADGTVIRGPVIKNCRFASLGDDSIGLFHQSEPMLFDNVIRDSFSRGIYNYQSEFKPGYEQSIEELNKLIRCRYFRQD